MKKLVRNNYRVEVYPPDPWSRGESDEDKHKTYLQAIRKLAEEIKRHCDIGNLSVTYDTAEVCSFCSSLWESPPACCEQAVDEGS